MTVLTSVRKIEATDSVPVKVLKRIISRVVSDLGFLSVISRNPEIVRHIERGLHDKYYSLLFLDDDSMVPYQDFVDEIQDQIFLVISNIEYKELPEHVTAKGQRACLGEFKSYAANEAAKYTIGVEVERMKDQMEDPSSDIMMMPLEEEDEEGEDSPVVQGHKKSVH